MMCKSGEVEQAEMQSIRLEEFRSLINLLKPLVLLFEEIRVLMVLCTDWCHWMLDPGGGGGRVLPYMGYIGMCGPKG